MPPHLGVIVTYMDVHGTWHATTVVTQSATQPDEWGYYAAHRLTGGECIGAMLDTHAPSGPSRYLVKLRDGVRDGARCRSGGPKRSNDPRGTGLPANALLYDTGWLTVRPFTTIEPLRPGLSARSRRRREVLFHYGQDYWARHERHHASLPPVRPRTKQTARRGTGGVAPRRRRALRGVALRLRGAGDAEEGPSAYELMRLARIRENNAALAALGIVPLASKLGAGLAAAQRKRPSVADASVQPSRGSSRLAELPRPNYVEEPDAARRVRGSCSATSVPKPPGRPLREADGASCTWDGQAGCWRERDGSQRPPGRAASVRPYWKRCVARAAETLRAEPTAADELGTRDDVHVVEGLEYGDSGVRQPPPPPLERDTARRVVLPAAISPAEDEALILNLDKILSRGGQLAQRPYGERDRDYLRRALRLGRGEAASAVFARAGARPIASGTRQIILEKRIAVARLGATLPRLFGPAEAAVRAAVRAAVNAAASHPTGGVGDHDVERGFTADSLRLHGGGDVVAEGASADAVHCRNADTLARLHPFPNDPNLLFDEASHTYTVFGAVPERSTTSLIAAFFDGFCPEAITDKYLQRWRDDPSSKYYPQIQSVLEDGGSEADAAACIQDEWSQAGSEASRLGTELHRYCEFELNGTPVAPPPELEAEVKQYHAWRQSPVVVEYELRPIRTELTVAWRVGECVVCAGQIDALFADKHGYYYVRVWRL